MESSQHPRALKSVFTRKRKGLEEKGGEPGDGQNRIQVTQRLARMPRAERCWESFINSLWFNDRVAFEAAVLQALGHSTGSQQVHRGATWLCGC